MSNPYISPYKTGQSAQDKQLEARRCDLLELINNKFDASGKFGNILSIDELKTAYNETISEQWKRQRGSFSDPLLAFPEDIWRPILEDVANSSLSKSYYSSLLGLLHVSQLWMTKMVSCPSLWRTIAILPREEDLLAKMACFLRLSQDLNITLQVLDDALNSFPQPGFDLLAHHRHRITTLFMEGNDHEKVTLCLIDRLGGLPSLEMIHGGPFNENKAKQLLSLVPTLREVNELEVSSPEGLTDFFVPLLNCVSLGIDLYDSQVLEENDNRLHFSRLQNLTVWRDHKICQYILTHLEAPLISLSVGCWSSENIDILLRLASQFPLLESLEIDVTAPHSKASGPVFQDQYLRSLPSVSSLKLNSPLIPRRYTQYFDQKAGFNARLIHTVRSSMPCLESLTLWRVPITENVVLLLKSLSQLRSLSIFIHDDYRSAEVLPIHLAKLEYLYWSTSASERDAHPFKTSSLAIYRYYSYSNHVSGENPVLAEPTLLPQGCWHSLVKLTITCRAPVLIALCNLPVLRELDFQATPGLWVSDVLEQLITLPKACPSLWKLGLGGRYRDWDILFLALERRNLLQDRAISRIREVHVNGLLPFRILYPLTQLLGGEFVQYSSLEEFTASEFSSPPDSLSQHCIDCGISLKESGSLMNIGSTIHLHDWGPKIESGWNYSIPTDTKRPDPPLKEEIKDWLASKWSRRQKDARYFDNLVKKDAKFLNCYSCWGNSTIITAYTLDGTRFED